MVMAKINYKDKWKNFKSSANENWIRVKEFSIKHWTRFYEIAIANQNTNIRKYLMLYFAWIGFLLFVSFSYLVEKNPFSLLVPFNLFALPLHETRTLTKVYVSDGEQNIFPSDRLVYLQDSIKDDIRTLLAEIGRPPYFSNLAQVKDKIASSKLKRLPNLSIALVSIWVQNNGKQIILDFSSREIEREMGKYRFPKSSYDISEDGEEQQEQSSIESYYSAPSNFIDEKTLKEIESKKFTVLGLVIDCIEETLFAQYPNLEKIIFKIDGRSVESQGLYIHFVEPRTRETK